jgi:hypothetical protein
MSSAVHQQQQPNTGWLSYSIAFQDAVPKIAPRSPVTDKNSHCMTFISTPPAAAKGLSSSTATIDSPGQSTAQHLDDSATRSNVTPLIKRSSLRAEAAPFYPPSAITCHSTAHAAPAADPFLSASAPDNRSPAVITPRGHLDRSPTAHQHILADSSSSAATDNWYDCATEFAPWSLLSGTDSQQSASEIGR